jgi:hypothetical protein
MKVICKDDTYHSNNKPILIVVTMMISLLIYNLIYILYSIIGEDVVERDIMSSF